MSSFAQRAASAALLFAPGAIVGPREAWGQWTEPAGAPRHAAVAVVAGTFGEGAATGGRHPLVAARAARGLSSWLLAEVGLGLTSAIRPVEQRFTDPSGRRDTASSLFKVPLLAPEVQMQAQAPFGPFRPYVGAGGGLLVAFRTGVFGQRFVRPTYFGAVGLRVDIGRRLGARGEFRLRADQYPGTGMVRGTEQTAGLMWKF